MRKILILIAALIFLSFTDSNSNLPRKGDSILNDAVKVCGYVNNHCLIYYYKDCDLKFGFIHARVLDFRIVVEAAEFDDVYTFAGYNVGCLIWVKKGSKWAVFDIDSYEVLTDFKYDKISEFKEKSVDNETHIGVYEAEVEMDGKREFIEIEKYICSCYYDY